MDKNFKINSISSTKCRTDRWITIEIIIPVYNEEEVLPILFKTLESVFSHENLKKNKIKKIQYLLIDDGSKDSSVKIILEHIKKGQPATLYRFTRNFGHQNAVSAGLEHATGDVVAVIDADLQDPPEVIFQMIEEWRKGFDVIYGIRKKRKENFLKVFAYWFFYRLLSFLSEIEIPLDSGDFSLIDKKVVQAMCDLPEKIRYPRVIRSWVGFKQTGIQYERFSRKAGKTKYPFKKLYKLATDGVASASVKPLRISQLFSVFFLVCLVILTCIIIFKFSYYLQNPNELALWFLFGYALISLCGFVQALLIYILSGYVGRSYLEIKGRPPYLIMEVINKKTVSNCAENEK